MNFVFFYAPLVFGNILHDSITNMAIAFECFRSAMLFYMRGGSMVSDVASFKELSAKAAKDMYTYASIMEDTAVPGVMTVNLRFLVIHLPRCASTLLPFKNFCFTNIVHEIIYVCEQYASTTCLFL